MIKKVVIKNFRSFDDDTIELHPEGVSLLVGGNNSGKSTFSRFDSSSHVFFQTNNNCCSLDFVSQ